MHSDGNSNSKSDGTFKDGTIVMGIVMGTVTVTSQGDTIKSPVITLTPLHQDLP